ncbi:hypothetical protein D3C76_1739030 [compost metagenome]
MNVVNVTCTDIGVMAYSHNVVRCEGCADDSHVNDAEAACASPYDAGVCDVKRLWI